MATTENGTAGSLAGKLPIWAELKQEIVAIAPSLGIDDIGFASADPFLSLKSILLEHRAKGYESGFEEPDIEKRVHPELSLEQPASLISIAVAYPSKMDNPPKSEPGKRRGILARSAWGQDYHHVLRAAMAKLEEFILSRVPEARLVNMVDTGALVDRAVAERAGIGFSGKNCAIISPKWGSWIYLGELITNIPFSPDTPVTEGCGECTKCLDACPTGALIGPGQLNAQRCISFLTQTKGFLEEEFMLKIGNRLYGCDTCQIVCPKNKGKSWNHRPELQPEPEVAKPLLLPLLDMSNREFKETFGSSAASWRGKKPMQRNAVIALGNFKDRDSVPKLIDIMQNDPRPVMRGTAAWSLSRIGGEEALEAINRAITTEQDAEVLERLKTAYEKLNGAEAEVLYYDEMDSVIGKLTLVTSTRGLCHIEFGPYSDCSDVLNRWVQRYYKGSQMVASKEALSTASRQLKEYFAGERRQFDLRLDLQGSEFQRKVWNALLTIPYVETASYKDIAEMIGQPKAVRAVGGANNKNPIPIIVPCHRVIGSNGSLVGYGGGLSIKESLLSLERNMEYGSGQDQ
ncbi:epoxyqueuosine reductase [Fontibacillus solani]|uniref:Methylated-DNA--protein-cysteine methyltransferase n=1 Tax=Fontibacillus solani TaxID=1572857 RepID=A0A7W3XTZ3_9BACL|nr:tRNA epoxyqueuosine(34) reductase QueG [Fontibacillus solani]MBA9088130.1 epoxyqueuosine reductase [Fontibacillus solani]